MLSYVRAAITLVCYTVNTVFWFVPIFLLGLLKLIPISALQKTLSAGAKVLASCWVSTNTLIQKLLTPTTINVNGLTDLKRNDWYLVIANHQSWVDILIMQRVLNKRIPFLNFFLKKELIYVPFLGLAWWALDFPFMKRTSKAQLKKNPKLRGKDMETTRKACEKFKEMPVSIVNFVEGTRFTPSKHKRQQSPFTHLLKPKAGGVAFVMQAMGEQLNKVVNVTIRYPNGIPTFVDFIAGRLDCVEVDIELLPVSQSWIGDYSNNAEFRVQFQAELNQLWQTKDLKLTNMAAGREKTQEAA